MKEEKDEMSLRTLCKNLFLQVSLACVEQVIRSNRAIIDANRNIVLFFFNNQFFFKVATCVQKGLQREPFMNLWQLKNFSFN